MRRRSIEPIPPSADTTLLSAARSTRYESQLVKRDAPVVAAMRELAAQYPRYGYRRIQVFLARRDHVMSANRTHRLWRL